MFAIDITQFDDPAKQEQYQRLTHELRCMQCLNTSIADSWWISPPTCARKCAISSTQARRTTRFANTWLDRYGEAHPVPPAHQCTGTCAFGSRQAIFPVIGGIAAVRILRQRAKLVDQTTC